MQETFGVRHIFKLCVYLNRYKTNIKSGLKPGHSKKNQIITYETVSIQMEKSGEEGWWGRAAQRCRQSCKVKHDIKSDFYNADLYSTLH